VIAIDQGYVCSRVSHRTFEDSPTMGIFHNTLSPALRFCFLTSVGYSSKDPSHSISSYLSSYKLGICGRWGTNVHDGNIGDIELMAKMTLNDDTGDSILYHFFYNNH
jgi:hypothetical protein